MSVIKAEEFSPEWFREGMRVGDVVQLKSGGPYMTIEKMDQPEWPNTVCTWIEAQNGLALIRREKFAVQCLKKLTPVSSELVSG